jgi:hypothetical protein
LALLACRQVHRRRQLGGDQLEVTLMLSDEQTDHFRTFGFVVLRRYLADQETAALSNEMDRAHRDAFGARFDERPDEGGMPGHYLPMMSRQRTPD